MNEEKLRILKMIEEGKITAEEGAKLMEAMDSSDSRETPSETKPDTGSGKTLIIKITEAETGRSKSDIKIPLIFGKAVTSLIPKQARIKLNGEGIDIDELLSSMNSGKKGSILDLTDSDGEDRVEIYIE